MSNQETKPVEQIVEIPLAKIRLNPRNPRKTIRPGQVEAKAASLKAIGLETPIKVRLLTEEERKADPAYEYELVGGELRFRAAQSLAWANILAYVVEVKPGALLLKALMDNMNEEMFWLDRFEAMEELKKDDASLTNQDLADILGVGRPKVSRVLTLMGVLGAPARDYIRSLITTTPDLADFLDSFETASLELGALADLPGTVAQAQERVETCLKAALDRRMTGAQVRQMVKSNLGDKSEKGERVKSDSNGTPVGEEAYSGTHSTPSGRSGQAEVAASQTDAPPKEEAQGTPHPAHLPEGTHREEPLCTPKTTAKGRGWSFLPQTKGKTTTAKSAFLTGVVGGFLAKNFKRALGTLARRYMIHAMAAIGLIFVIGPHLSSLTHLISGNRESKAQVTAQVPIQPAIQPVQKPQRQVAHKTTRPKKLQPQGNVSTAHLSTGPQAGGRALVVPSQGAKSNDGTQVGSVPVASNKSIPAWAQDDLPAAGDFAGRFYGISYSNWDDTLGYLKARMVGGGAQAAVDQYFPASLLKEMQTKMLAEYFSAKSTQVIGGEGDRAQILVQGTVTTLSRVGRNPQTVSTKPAALLLAFRLVEGFGSKIEKVAEVDPKTAGAPTQTADLGKQIGDGIHDAGDAVNKADAAGSAVDKAKNLLGF